MAAKEGFIVVLEHPNGLLAMSASTDDPNEVPFFIAVFPTLQAARAAMEANVLGRAYGGCIYPYPGGE